MSKTASRVWTLVAGVTGVVLLATGCGTSTTSGAKSTAASSTEKITLTVATFNEFGYEKLLAEYTKLHPNITVTQKKAATSNEARDNMNTRLAAGSGLSDVEAIEVDWLPELMQYPTKFTDLKDKSVDGRWLPWKVAQATTKDGVLLGYGTDIGPEGVCYRSDLFKKAGLPTDRAAVAKLLGGANATWDDYFAAGKKFKATDPKTPWMDSAGATYQGMINQVKNAYEKDDGTIVAATNPE
ncbi:MAG TPA: ABC transporter substrate-binding protein, partial [Dermatophilaceae bacterium]